MARDVGLGTNSCRVLLGGAERIHPGADITLIWSLVDEKRGGSEGFRVTFGGLGPPTFDMGLEGPSFVPFQTWPPCCSSSPRRARSSPAVDELRDPGSAMPGRAEDKSCLARVPSRNTKQRAAARGRGGARDDAFSFADGGAETSTREVKFQPEHVFSARAEHPSFR